MILRPQFSFEKNFAQIPNLWLRDSRLSYRSRGVLVYMMSHQAGWNISLKKLVEEGSEGREAIQKALAELRAAGYMKTVPAQEEGTGKLIGQAHELTDPADSTVLLENRRTVKPYDGESDPKNTIYKEHQIKSDRDSDFFGADSPAGDAAEAAAALPSTASVIKCLARYPVDVASLDIAAAIADVMGRTTLQVASPAAYVAKAIRTDPSRWLLRAAPAQAETCEQGKHRYIGQWSECCVRCDEMRPGWELDRDAA
ncbi:hypothetical protein B7R22_09845 [Subtercola boreus]|uniref:Uncharacterized protein n=2 Tax=Subtercola boreus TaxID=120213 RepID=A0A3E0VYZ2_9MICO|nr:hypothetical protein B7R22_09845 [Subtercola boreus]